MGFRSILIKSNGGFNISTQTVLGDAYIERGDYIKAMDSYKKALNDNPSDGHSAGKIAHLLLMQSKDNPDAFKQALELLPRIPSSEKFTEIKSILQMSSNNGKITLDSFQILEKNLRNKV